jgi:TetR/AcrR family transcriptional regulator, transcriptional repressor for nem operon
MNFTPRSEETRQFIIEKTANIFNKKGYAGTSMSDLTEATQLTKGSIYGNFENKEAVALAVFDYNIERKNKAIAQKLQQAVNYKERLIVYALIFCSKENVAFLEGGCPLLNAGTEADDTHEPLRKKVGNELLSWKKNISNTIKDGMTAKEFHRDTDVERIALSIMALVEGGIFIGRTTKNKKNLDVILETVKELIETISL